MVTPGWGLQQEALRHAYSPRQRFGQFATGLAPSVRRSAWQYQPATEAAWMLRGTPLASDFTPATDLTPAGPGLYDTPYSSYVDNLAGGLRGMYDEGTGLGQYGDMIARAQQAAMYGQMSEEDMLKRETIYGEGSQRAISDASAWERWSGDEGVSNQNLVAQALAMRRPTGGMYGGQVGRGIQAAMQARINQRARQLDRAYGTNVGDTGYLTDVEREKLAPSSFLNWYLTSRGHTVPDAITATNTGGTNTGGTNTNTGDTGGGTVGQVGSTGVPYPGLDGMWYQVINGSITNVPAPDTGL